MSFRGGEGATPSPTHCNVKLPPTEEYTSAIKAAATQTYYREQAGAAVAMGMISVHSIAV